MEDKIKRNKVAARGKISFAFEDDPEFRNAYVANIAMLLHDHYGITDPKTRNAAGSDIVKLVFES